MQWSQALLMFRVLDQIGRDWFRKLDQSSEQDFFCQRIMRFRDSIWVFDYQYCCQVSSSALLVYSNSSTISAFSSQISLSFLSQPRTSWLTFLVVLSTLAFKSQFSCVKASFILRAKDRFYFSYSMIEIALDSAWSLVRGFWVRVGCQKQKFGFRFQRSRGSVLEEKYISYNNVGPYNKIIMKLKVILPKPQFQSYKEIDNRWSEIKMTNPFTARQAFAFTSQGDIGYLHGGYNCDEGILGDMHTAKFNDPDDRAWCQIEQKGSLPGKLRYHTLTSYLCYLICVGGQRSQVRNNQEVYCFNLKMQAWSKLQVSSQDTDMDSNRIRTILGRDSHCSYTHSKNLYIFGGYSLGQGEYLNDLVQLNLEKIDQGKISLSIIKTDKEIPAARSNFASCTLADNMYIFGGTNSLEFFQDFWRFSFSGRAWENLTQGQTGRFYWPEKRKGAVLVPYLQSQSLILFGGMQTITKQQNDLSIYSIPKSQWVRIHSNTNNIYDPSPTLKQQPETSPTIIFHKSRKQIKEKEKEKEKGEFKLGINSVPASGEEEQGRNGGRGSFLRGHSSGKSEFNHKVCKTQMSFSRAREDEQAKGYKSANNTNKNFFTKKQSLHKMSVVQQKRYRQFMARKKRLLSQIYSSYHPQPQPTSIPSSNQNPPKKRPYSPTSECLNYTLHQLGEQPIFNPPKNPQFQLPKVIFDDKKSQVIGKKPCARDGHAAFCVGSCMFIVGGDRHMVSFNDVHLLRMEKAVESVGYYS